MTIKTIVASISLTLSAVVFAQSETPIQAEGTQAPVVQVNALSEQTVVSQPLDDTAYQLQVEAAQREARKRIRAFLTAKRTPITSENCLTVIEKTIQSSPYQMFIQEGETISLVPVFSNWSLDMALDEKTTKEICPQKEGTLIATFLPEKFARENPKEYAVAVTLAEKDQMKIQRAR